MSFPQTIKRRMSLGPSAAVKRAGGAPILARSGQTARSNKPHDCDPESGEFDVGGEGMGLGQNFAAIAEILDMVGDGMPELVLDFTAGPTRRDATGKVRGISGVTGTALLDDDQILFHDAGKASETVIRQRSG